MSEFGTPIQQVQNRIEQNIHSYNFEPYPFNAMKTLSFPFSQMSNRIHSNVVAGEGEESDYEEEVQMEEIEVYEDVEYYEDEDEDVYV